MIRIEEDANFTFTFHANRSFDLLSGGENGSGFRTYLEKWGLLPDTQLLCFRYDQFYHRGLAAALLKSFFSSETVREHFALANGHGAMNVGMPYVANLATDSIQFRELTCTQTTLDMFDKLVDGEIVRGIPLDDDDASKDQEDDDEDEKTKKMRLKVCQMMDVYLPCGVTVSDQVRGLFMLGEESEHFGLFSEEERSEFLYHVMWRLCAGGSLNQWEDDFNVYRDAARTLYKDTVCVGRVADEDDGDATGAAGNTSLQVLSHVLQVESVDGVPLFPRDDQVYPSNGNYLYVVVNAPRKEIVVWYHGFWSSF